VSELFDQLRAQFGDTIIEEVATTSPYILVKTDAIREIARFCRDLGFDSLMCLSAVDTKGIKADTKPLPAGSPKTAKSAPPPEQFWVVYHLGSTTTREKAALKVIADRTDPHVPSVCDVWRVANWHEREAFDMYGIIFEGHPNLTRILCCDPLRKDYVFPTSYHDVPHERMPSGGESAERNLRPAGACAPEKEPSGGH
jgi:NADH-quinone oxidoreductase subunit C